MINNRNYEIDRESIVYHSIEPYSEGLACIFNGKKYGYIDINGRLIIPCKYDIALPFSEGLAVVRYNGNCGYIDKEGKEVIPFIYNHASSFKEGLAPVCKKKWGYIDKTGKVIIDFKYLFADPFSEGLAQISLDGKLFGFMDKDESVVIPCIHQDVAAFKEGLALVIKDSGIGYINRSGVEIIPCIYRDTSGFADGLTSVMDKDETWHLFDINGNKVFTDESGDYEGIGLFYKGLAFANKNDYRGVINKNEETVIPFMYDEDFISLYMGDLIVLSKNKKCGAVDINNQIVIPFEYENITVLAVDRYLLRKTGEESLLTDQSGNVIATYHYKTSDFGKSGKDILWVAVVTGAVLLALLKFLNIF